VVTRTGRALTGFPCQDMAKENPYARVTFGSEAQWRYQGGGPIRFTLERTSWALADCWVSTGVIDRGAVEDWGEV